MNITQTVLESAATSNTVSGTITVAGSCAVLAIAVSECTTTGKLTGTAGWTQVSDAVLSSRFAQTAAAYASIEAWHINAPAAGDVSFTATFTPGSGTPTSTQMLLFLVEVGGATQADAWDYDKGSIGLFDRPIDVVAGEITVTVSREGNACILAFVTTLDASDLTAATGYTAETETDLTSGVFCFAVYSKPGSLPEENPQTGCANAAEDSPLDVFTAFLVEMDAPRSALIGSDF